MDAKPATETASTSSPDAATARQMLGRRRLLGRALVAPALATVCTGSAFGSPSLRSATCLAKSQGVLTDPSAAIFGADSFVRVNVYTLASNRYVKRADLVSVGKGAGFLVPGNPSDPDEYIQIDTVTGQLGVVLTPRPPVPALSPGSGVLVRFDQDGFVVGTGGGYGGAPGAITSMMCWASVLATP